MNDTEPSKSEPTEYDKLWRSLRRQEGFGLFFVEADGAERGRVVAALQRYAAAEAPGRFTVPATGEESRVLLEGLLKGTHAPLEGGLVVDGDAVAWDDDGRLLRDLNVARDRLRVLVHGPLVVVVRKKGEQRWRQEAPDLFDVRAGFVHFTSESQDVRSSVDRAHGWDEDAFVALLLHLVEGGKAWLMRRGVSLEDAEDLSLDAAIRVIESLHQRHLSIEQLFRLTLRHIWLDEQRREQRTHRFAPSALTPDRSPAFDESIEAGALLRIVLERLSIVERDLFAEYYLEDRPVHEIAQDMGLTVKAVEARLDRLQATLRDHLGSTAVSLTSRERAPRSRRST